MTNCFENGKIVVGRKGYGLILNLRNMQSFSWKKLESITHLCLLWTFLEPLNLLSHKTQVTGQLEPQPGPAAEPFLLWTPVKGDNPTGCLISSMPKCIQIVSRIQGSPPSFVPVLSTPPWWQHKLKQLIFFFFKERYFSSSQTPGTLETLLIWQAPELPWDLTLTLCHPYILD